MKKLILFLVVVFCVAPNFAAKADGNGQLVLDPSIITNSNIGVGTTSDFPEVAQLFLEVKASSNSSNILESNLPDVNFGVKQTIQTINYTPQVQKLFVNYHPQVIIGSSDITSSQSNQWVWIWYVAIVVITIPLFFLVIKIGKQQAQRRLKKGQNEHYI